MLLENYFDFIDGQAIRIKGTRIGIEVIIEDFLDGASPEEIAIRYPNLALEQVYATITYYLSNRKKVDAYIVEGQRAIEQAAQAQDAKPDSLILRLRRLKESGLNTVRE